MSPWSPENATKAYLRAVKMGKTSKEPDAAEFISALAAGNNAQLMVLVSDGADKSATLALVAAGQQTNGRVVCIRPPGGLHKLQSDVAAAYADKVEFVTGDARTLLMTDYNGADFVLIDSDIDDYKGVFLAAQRGARSDGALIVGYNALNKGSCECGQMTYFLPIGKGLQVTKIAPPKGKVGGKQSRWIVKVDKCTGEEHVFRITSSQERHIAA